MNDDHKIQDDGDLWKGKDGGNIGNFKSNGLPLSLTLIGVVMYFHFITILYILHILTYILYLLHIK